MGNREPGALVTKELHNIRIATCQKRTSQRLLSKLIEPHDPFDEMRAKPKFDPSRGHDWLKSLNGLLNRLWQRVRIQHSPLPANEPGSLTELGRFRINMDCTRRDCKPALDHSHSPT